MGYAIALLNELNEIGEMDHLVSNQPMYSMLEQTIEDDLLDWSSAHSVGILAYSPMHSGLLTGEGFSRLAQFLTAERLEET